jgi:hypothetical protein
MKKSLTLFAAILMCSLTGFAASRITGILGSCVGSVSRLNDSTIGGTWSSSNPSIATVNSTTGNVYGVASGTCTISYTVGSTINTASYTVTARPSGITGVPSSICIGSSIALSCATSGGTWSTTWSATISSGGVFTASRHGLFDVHYTVGIGCAADTTVNVIGSYVDSVIGVRSLCVGSSSAYRMSSLTGGTWSSSNPSVATVSSTGVLTGVSAGTVTLSYTVTACGTAVSTTSVNIVTSMSAGTLSGPSSLWIGTTAAMSSSVRGGTWTSGSPSIASIDTWGRVTGVSAGSATMTYSYLGCGTTTIATYTLSVASFPGISGMIRFNARGRIYGSVKVWLITFNRSTNMLQAVDSTTIVATHDSIYYEFLTAATDTYRVKVQALDTSRGAIFGYIPTYHDTSYYWHTASVIPHVSGVGDMHKNIDILYGTAVSGPGFIAGDVTTGANKGTADGVPAAGIRVILINQTSNQLVGSTVTNWAGRYSFSGLPVGQTYQVFPEAMSYITTPMSGINLTSSSSSFSAASFSQGTLSKTIKPITVGMEQTDRPAGLIEVYPNPAKTKVNLKCTVYRQQNARLTLSDMAGRTLTSSEIMFSEGSNIKSIDVSGIASGYYMLTIWSADFTYATKIQIEH